jgi:hypothetical protein
MLLDYIKPLGMLVQEGPLRANMPIGSNKFRIHFDFESGRA